MNPPRQTASHRPSAADTRGLSNALSGVNEQRASMLRDAVGEPVYGPSDFAALSYATAAASEDVPS